METVLETVFEMLPVVLLVCAWSAGLPLVTWGLWKVWAVLWRWWRRDRLAWEADQRYLKHLPESVREGSPFLTAKNPDFLVGIYGVLRDEKLLIATGWRYKDWIVTAGHAVRESSFSRIVICYKGVYLEPHKWYSVASDLSVCKYEEAWGIPTARIDSVNLSCHVQVFAAVAQDNSSMGILKHVPSVAMGFTEYSGSTRPAFSGAPYYNGIRVLGMHLGGGSVANYGYSASYIDMCIKRWLKSRRGYRTESSELEFVRRVLKSARAKDVEWDRQLDETYVRVGGRYLVIDNDEWDELAEDEDLERFFYEFEEDADRRIKRRRNKNWKEENDDEPDYEPEGADFLEKRPKDSPSEGLDQASERPVINTSEIQDIKSWMEEITRGQQDVMMKFGEVCKSVQDNVQQQLEATKLQLQTSMTTQLEQSLELIRSDFAAQLCQVKTDLTVISDTASASSTQKVQQASENSASSQPSEMRWDGMDTDFNEFMEWRSSKNASSVEYTRLRESYLTSKGFSAAQKKALIARCRNKVSKDRARRSRASLKDSKPVVTPSNSS